MSQVSVAKQSAAISQSKPDRNRGNLGTPTHSLLPEEQFRLMLCRERKRSERSHRHLLLMLIDNCKDPGQHKGDISLTQIADILNSSIRETDVAGWFEHNSVLGVVFTEFGDCEVSLAVKTIEAKVMGGLRGALKTQQLSKLQISFYAFPDGWTEGQGRTVDSVLYPDLFEEQHSKRFSLLIKRCMDTIGSFGALALLTPVFLILAVLVKLTSNGPVFFRQERVGQYGARFVFLKFRSMYVSTDATIHKEYVRNFIAGRAGTSRAEENKEAVYKITNDPRVTWIGRFMRRTSLDELPQFWNVLRGEMSLVGPRPPIPYELEAYDLWHRRRLLESKPGITGLWQVHGRSKTTFDEMVRLDLEYSRTWSPILDLKILLETPRAVLSGDGAY